MAERPCPAVAVWKVPLLVLWGSRPGPRLHAKAATAAVLQLEHALALLCATATCAIAFRDMLYCVHHARHCQFDCHPTRGDAILSSIACIAVFTQCPVKPTV